MPVDIRNRQLGAGRAHASAKRQFLITVEGIDGYFAVKTGGRTKSSVTRAYNGGDKQPEVIAGPGVPDDLTVRRPYKPTRDQAVIERLKPMCGSWRTTITQTPTDADLVPIARPAVFRALLVDVGDPDADAGSGDAAELELTFAIEGGA